MTVTERLTEGVRTALAAAGLPVADDCAWEVPRQAEHGDYATNVAMTLARAAKRPPRQIADALAKNFSGDARGRARRGGRPRIPQRLPGAGVDGGRACTRSSPPAPRTGRAPATPASARAWSSSPPTPPARSSS